VRPTELVATVAGQSRSGVACVEAALDVDAELLRHGIGEERVGVSRGVGGHGSIVAALPPRTLPRPHGRGIGARPDRFPPPEVAGRSTVRR
jgi:hypothetical protein